MAGKQSANDDISSNLGGMSMSQLYEIMSQMKILIDQNPEQAKQILVNSPAMTKSLFQAQILLGMVKTPQVMPSNQQALSQAPQQSVKSVQPSSGQAKPLPVQIGQLEVNQQIPARKQQPNQPLPVQVGQQEVNQQIPARKQQPNHPVSSVPSAAVLPVTHKSETMPSYSHPVSSVPSAAVLPVTHKSETMPSYSHQSTQPAKEHMSTMPSYSHQSTQPAKEHMSTMPSYSHQSTQPAKEHMSTHGTSISHPQSFQVHTMHPPQFHSSQQPPSFHKIQNPHMSSQSQQSLHSQGAQHHSLQPPLPSQPRPPSMQPFQHQHHSQMGPLAGFQTSAPSQSHISQQQFIGNRHPASIGFPTQPIPNQPPLQSVYQGGSHVSANFNHQGGSSNTQMDMPTWMPGPQDNSTGRSQLPGPPPLPGQMGPSNQTPRPPQLTNEMEKVLLQQVLSLTPEQINLLPPEQRHQVLQLQQMLR